MAAIGLIMHLGRDEASTHARDLAVWLLNEGHSVRVPPDDAEVSGMANHMVEPANFADGLDVCVTLGGDGSILRAVELLGTAVVPILGVDHGQLGYLTEVEPSGAQTAVARVLQGDFEVVERAADANTIRLAVDLDDEFFTTYAADGLIVATPTGSTAYAFSARGPIIDPTHSALLLTPVSPHMLFDRSLVLAPSTRVRLTIDGHRPATVSVDGRRVAIVGDGDTIECSAADHSAQMVSLGPRRFHRVLKAKFGLNDR
jgi:NAD+ kinase